MAEQIVVKLPLPLDLACVVMRGVGHFFPNAKVLMDPSRHTHGPDALVIEIERDDLRNYDDDLYEGDELLSRMVK